MTWHKQRRGLFDMSAKRTSSAQRAEAEKQRRQIIQQIRRLHRNKTPLNYLSIRKSHGPLLTKARESFGNWQTAIEAAGLDYDSIRRIRRWSKELIIEQLQTLDEQAQFASISDLRYKYSALYGACCRHFGSGLAALQAAEIDYDQLLAERSDRWTKAKVIDHLCDRYAQDMTLCRNVILRDEPDETRFCYSATHHFGNWAKALKAAGLDPEKIRNRDGLWPRPRVLAEIRRRHTQGKLLNTDAMLRENLTLHAAGRRHFGTWEQAVNAAGVDYNRQVRGGLRGWTKPKVHRALRRRIQEKRASREYVRTKSPALFRAAVHHYGSWKSAINTAQRNVKSKA